MQTISEIVPIARFVVDVATIAVFIVGVVHPHHGKR